MWGGSISNWSCLFFFFFNNSTKDQWAWSCSSEERWRYESNGGKIQNVLRESKKCEWLVFQHFSLCELSSNGVHTHLHWSMSHCFAPYHPALPVSSLFTGQTYYQYFKALHKILFFYSVNRNRCNNCTWLHRDSLNVVVTSLEKMTTVSNVILSSYN